MKKIRCFIAAAANTVAATYHSKMCTLCYNTSNLFLSRARKHKDVGLKHVDMSRGYLKKI